MPDNVAHQRVFVCKENELAVGEARSVALPKDEKQLIPYTVIVLRDKNGTLRAFLNECKHIPVPLDAGSGQFWDRSGEYLICSTHGAIFQSDDGLCIHGPCHGASLDPMPLCIEDGNIYVINKVPDWS